MKILMIMILLVFSASADWETSIKLNHKVMSKAYVDAANSIEADSYLLAKEKMDRANMMCRGQIAMAQSFRDDMDDSDKDKAKLTHYIEMVSFYCSKVAGCKCSRE